MTDVVLVRWPEENERLERLRAAGAPRLLLVGEDLAAPEPVDPLEDWIRLPPPRTTSGSACRPSPRGPGAPPSRRRSTTTDCCATGAAGSRLSPVERALAAALDRPVQRGGRSRHARAPGVAGWEPHPQRARRPHAPPPPPDLDPRARGPHRPRPWLPAPGARTQRRGRLSRTCRRNVGDHARGRRHRWHVHRRRHRRGRRSARCRRRRPIRRAVSVAATSSCAGSVAGGARARHHGGDQRAARTSAGTRRAGDDTGLRRRDRDRAPGAAVALRRARRPAGAARCHARLRFEVGGRLDAHGHELEPFDGVVPDVGRGRRGGGVPAPRRPRPVPRTRGGRPCSARAVTEVVCSHEVSPEFREYERMVTTVADAVAARGVRAVPRRASVRSPTTCW